MKARKVASIGCGTVLVVVAPAIAFLGYAMFGNQSHYATNVTQHELAPASATSIEVYEARNISGAVSLSYVVEEGAFRKFAAEKGWSLSSGSGTIRVHPPSLDYSAMRTLKNLDAYLSYERRQSNGGGITVYYIPSESRAYIDKSNR